MKCKDARKRTYVSEYPEVVHKELLEARKHIKECPQCRDFFEGEMAFGSLLRNIVKKNEVPPELINRILTMRCRKAVKGVYLRVAAVASLLFLVIAGSLLIPHGDSAPVIKQIVNDHMQFLPSSDIQISASASEQVETWFRGKVDFPVRIPQIAARLRGGRLCFLDGKRFALVFYEHADAQISLFITEGMAFEKINIGSEEIVKGRKVRFVEDRGYNLLLWKERGLSYALISDLDASEIKKVF